MHTLLYTRLISCSFPFIFQISRRFPARSLQFAVCMMSHLIMDQPRPRNAEGAVVVQDLIANAEFITLPDEEADEGV